MGVPGKVKVCTDPSKLPSSIFGCANTTYAKMLSSLKFMKHVKGPFGS